MRRMIIGITVVGKDREGIVATFTNFVFEKHGNIEKVNQNVIKGLFGMYIEASFARTLNVSKFDSEIQNLAKETEMDVSINREIGSQKNIAILVTKEPLCLQSILEAAGKNTINGNISVVVGTEDTLEPVAKDAGVPFITINERDQSKAETQLIKICKKYKVDLIVLARYMRILNPNFVWRYPNRIINIHPSLLPAFPGALAYAQAYERGTKIVGVTAHYVTENLDQGPIIFQDSFNVDPDDTLEKIKDKGQKLEAATLLKAVKMHLKGKLDVRWRKVHVKAK